MLQIMSMSLKCPDVAAVSIFKKLNLIYINVISILLTFYLNRIETLDH